MFEFQQPHINPYHTYRVDQYHNVPQPMPRTQQIQPNQFYLHENAPPQPPARRTWAQNAANADLNKQPVIVLVKSILAD